jgi:hypothetical protein
MDEDDRHIYSPESSDGGIDWPTVLGTIAWAVVVGAALAGAIIATIWSVLR